MRGSSAPERPRLAGPGLLVALAGAVAGALGVLSPEPALLRPVPTQASTELDEVALAWLRSALVARPEDVALRLQLARGQLRLALHDEAARTVEPLLRLAGREGAEARLIAFEVRRMRWHRVPDREEARVLEAMLGELLEAPLHAEEQERLLQLALELGRPGLAAMGAERLAEAQSPRRTAWLREAGRQWLAAGDAARAADCWVRGAESAREAVEGEALAVQALEAARGMPDPSAALALVERVLARFPERRTLLEGAVAVALAHGAPARANGWASGLARLVPSDVETWRRRREVALAAGDLEGALDACRRLVGLLPEEAGEWRELARVAEWAGDTVIALSAWRWLALHAGSPEAVSRSVLLARQSWDGWSLVAILESQLRRGKLTDEGFSLLVEAYEHLGEPERAEALLRARSATRPWLRELASLQARRGRLEAALATWEVLERKGEDPVEARRAQGELLWRLRRAPEALDRLRTARAWAGTGALGYWRLLAELAWNQEVDEEARVAYQVLREHAPEDALVELRLVRLLAAEGWEAEREGRWEEARGHYARALAVGGGDGPARLGLLRMLVRLGEREALAGRLAQWWPEAERDPAYFEPYARALWLLERRDEATVWLGRWAQSRPEDGWAGLEYAQALAETGQAGAARRAFEASLAVLRPEVEAAVERLPAPEAVEVVLRAVRAARHHGDVPAARGWAEVLQARAADSTDVQDWALAHALEREDTREVRCWVERIRRSGRQPPPWVLMRLALEDDDEAALSALLVARGAELSLLDRITAERWLGRRAHARELLASAPRGGLLAVEHAALAVHERELAAQLEPRVRLLASSERLGPLALTRFGLEGHVAGPGESLLRVRAAHHLLESVGPGRAREVEAILGVTLGPDRRTTDVVLGLTWRDSRLLPSLLVRRHVVSSPRLRLLGEAAWSETAEESASLRLSGRLHRLSGALILGLPWSGEATATIMARQYRTLALTRLGEALGGMVQVSWPWRLLGVEGRLGLGSALERRWSQPVLPAELTALLPSSPPRPLPPGEAASVGLEMRVGRERREGEWGSYLLEAWSGWLWPEGCPGYRLRLGVGLALPSLGELTARLAIGGAGQAGGAELHRAVELGWEYRL